MTQIGLLNTSKSRRIQIALVLSFASILMQNSVAGPPIASAHTGVQCGYGYPTGPNGNCYALNRWPGYAYGARAHVWVQPYRCNNCNTTTYDHLNQTLWIADNTPAGTTNDSYMEVGYGGLWQRSGQMGYYYANTRGGQGQQIVDIATVPSAHNNSFSDIVITRNLQSATNAKVGIYRGQEGQPPSLYWATVTDTPMGTSTWLLNTYDIGVELRSGATANQSTNGWIEWRYMKWQSNTGTYYYQNNIGSGTIDESFDHLETYWGVYPYYSNTYGGVFSTHCICAH